jgi:SAM-dependent methyltransferase
MIERTLRRFARVVTNAVVTRPTVWPVFRPVFRRQWNLIAKSWDRDRRPDSYDPLLAALDTLPASPARVLDVGTGTGGAAFAIARRFPDADVVGVDFSDEMIRLAQAKTRAVPDVHVSFKQADASALPFADGQFDLVTLNNVIPFFDEIARVLRPAGCVVFAYSSGADTPIYVPPDRLESELGRRGFREFVSRTEGRGSFFIAGGR